MLITGQSLGNNLIIFLVVLITLLISSCSFKKNDVIYKKNDVFYKTKNTDVEPDSQISLDVKNIENNNDMNLFEKKILLLAMGYLPFEERYALNYNYDLFYSEYSKKLGVNFSGNENRDLLTAIAEWMGTPYLWGGCSESGIDCSCLVKNIYEEVFGVSLDRNSFMMFENNVIPVEKEDLITGDLIAFEIKNSKISHVGIYIKDNKFVHASLSKGVIISSLDQKYYKKRFIAGGRVIASQSIKLAKLSVKDFPEG